MTNTIAQVIAYARAHPTNNGGSWHNWCEAFVYRCGNFGQSFGTAQLAGDASGPLNRNYATAPSGAIHYWGGGGVGHVGFELGGGLVLMASDGVTTLWGTAMGTATVPAYNARKPSMSYRGWSLRHGTQTLNLTSTAGTGTPITATGKNASMTTLYYTEPTPTTTLFALAGDGVGDAAWLETADPTLANQLAGAHHISQRAVHLTPASFASWKAAYQSGAKSGDSFTVTQPTATAEQVAAEVIRQQKLPGN